MKVTIFGIYAVGMRHYGNSSLVVGEAYLLKRDRDNPHDDNAVAVVERAPGRRKWASIQSGHAAIIAGLFDQRPRLIRDDKVFLKPKGRPSYHSRWSGFAQRCNVGFYLSASDRQEVERLLSGSGLRFQFSWFFSLFRLLKTKKNTKKIIKLNKIK